jgi:uncharacterized caspase-like protein
MRTCLVAIAALVSAMFALGDASAFVVNKRVALVIGNSTYQHAVTLPNPVADSRLIGQTLRDAGFEVIEGADLDKIDMGKLLDQFTEAAYDADVAVVYYAGHGLQVDGHNYLIPTDAELAKASQLQTRTIPVEDVLAALPPDPAVGIVILDACRDNPLARTLAAALPKSRSMGAGLAPLQASGLSHDAGGLLIAYATDPGAVAYDGTGEHSPYTTALAKHLTTPGLEVQGALTRVRADVSEATNGAQRPWVSASLAREVYVGGAAPVIEAKAATPEQPQQPAVMETKPAGQEVDWTVEQKLWDEASKRNTIAHYELYLKQFPEGRFAPVAKLNLDQLTAEAASTEQASRSNTTPEAVPASDGGQAMAAESSVPAMPTDAATPAGEAVAGQQPVAQAPEQVALNTPPGSQSRTAVAVSEEVQQTPGTPQTEAAVMLDRDGKIDLQLRLNALGHYTGAFDGSLGPRSRQAIGAWQTQNHIVQTTYLTPEQHLLLVVQSDPVVGEVRAAYEKQKAEWAASQAKKPTKTTAKSTTKKKQQVATTTTRRKKTSETASDGAQYKPRNKGSSGDAAVGGFAAGALLGTGLGLVLGNGH